MATAYFGGAVIYYILRNGLGGSKDLSRGHIDVWKESQLQRINEMVEVLMHPNHDTRR
tara:strand:+ start:105 stop:278 length:174 start_codon:yes stop_codon:yes gene_type:complete